MILIDYSSILHRKIFTSVSQAKPGKINGEFITKDFITLTKHYILKELQEIELQYKPKYGEIVICIDNKSPEGYWRKDFDKEYKANRKTSRDKSEINYNEVFEELNDLTEAIELHTPWKCLDVHRAEADDTMLFLAEHFNENELILIHSPDKDMVQAQFNAPNVFQYSAMTSKWLTGESKAENMESWLLEHICLGDVSDNVPKIVDNSVFSSEFKTYLTYKKVNEKYHEPYILTEKIGPEVVDMLIGDYDVFKQNRKGETLDIKDVYTNPKLGPKTLHKQIDKLGSLDAFLDSNPLFRTRYDLNRILVLTEGIPDYIRIDILKSYENASTEYNKEELKKYLTENNLNAFLLEIPTLFKTEGELTADDFNW